MRQWDNYQSGHNSGEWRLEHLRLKTYGGPGKTLLDLGANKGDFCIPRIVSDRIFLPGYGLGIA